MIDIKIRERTIDDVNNFCEFLIKLDNEAKYMLFEIGERNVSKEVVLKNTESVIGNGDTCYIAVDKDKIIGFIIAVREKFIRTNHVATVVIGILEEYCSKGIGYTLFQNIFSWASENNVKRLELTVITENKRAVNLYKKLGFNIEGVRTSSTLIDGIYYDEYYMAKIIDDVLHTCVQDFKKER